MSEITPYGPLAHIVPGSDTRAFMKASKWVFVVIWTKSGERGQIDAGMVSGDLRVHSGDGYDTASGA